MLPLGHLGRLMKHGGKVRQVAFVFVEQAVEANRGIVMGRPAEGVETERNVKARLAHRAVAFVEVATQAKAMGPGELADNRVAGIATGLGQLVLFRGIRVVRRAYQKIRMHIRMCEQPANHI